VPGAPEAFQPAAPVAVDERMHDVTYDWASPLAKHVGTVVHRWLEKITRDGADQYSAERVAELHPAFRHTLLAEDTDVADIDRGTEMVSRAILNSLEDDTGRWLMTNTHEASACELPVTGMFHKQMKSLVIDRTFLDEQGVRWIVDYKTSPHEGGGLHEFLALQVERYSDQLRMYRDTMQLLEPGREIRTALYFPLLAEFREVELD
jgi:ATP-dependent helicase/nuclease subunit A